MGHLKNKMGNNGKDILRKNNYDREFKCKVGYAYRILCQESVCNIQASCNILALLATIPGIYVFSPGMA